MMKNNDAHTKFLKKLERMLAGKKPGGKVKGERMLAGKKPGGEVNGDRMLAGIKRGGKAGGDLTGDDAQLLALGAELRDARPEPLDEFVAKMDARVAALTGLEPDEVDGLASDHVISRPGGRGLAGGRWALPSWLTLPRAAAVATALIIGLGAFGLTRAIIIGGYNGTPRQSQQTSSVGAATPATKDSVVSSNGAPGSPGEPATLEKITGENAGATGSGNAAQAAAGIAGSYSVTAGTGGTGLPTTQKILQTATYEIEVPQGDFQKSYDGISALAARYGGYVVAAETHKNKDDSTVTGDITIRVSTAQDGFSRALSELDGIGTVLSRDISGQDVTEEYVDLQSRLRNAEAQEAQLLALMQKAQTIDEILMVQSRLSDIQSQIEQIKGRINYMDSRTDFATISVSLREAGAEEPTVAADDTTEWGFVGALVYSGWLAVQSVNFVIMALGVIIPLALIGGLIFAAGLWLARRRGGGS